MCVRALSSVSMDLCRCMHACPPLFCPLLGDMCVKLPRVYVSKQQIWRHIQRIMSCRAGRCQGIWLTANCPTAVISVFLVGGMLKTKNDWNDSDLPAWSAGLPLTTAWKYWRQQHSGDVMVSLRYDCVCGGDKKGLTQSLHDPASRATPGEIST